MVYYLSSAQYTHFLCLCMVECLPLRFFLQIALSQEVLKNNFLQFRSLLNPSKFALAELTFHIV